MNSITITRSPWAGGKGALTTLVVGYVGTPLPVTEAVWAGESGGTIWVLTPGFTNATNDPHDGLPYDYVRKPGSERSAILKEDVFGLTIVVDEDTVD